MRNPQTECDLFNAINPIGTEVLVKRDNGDLQTTTTRSKAEVLSGHSAVIWLDGISGCYLLSRVSVPRALSAQEGSADA